MTFTDTELRLYFKFARRIATAIAGGDRARAAKELRALLELVEPGNEPRAALLAARSSSAPADGWDAALSDPAFVASLEQGLENPRPATQSEGKGRPTPDSGPDQSSGDIVGSLAAKASSSSAPAELDAVVEIRATHHYGFRSGEWATVTGLEWANDRPCYRVRFPDGTTDSWVVSDPSDPYEFRAARLTSSPENPA